MTSPRQAFTAVDPDFEPRVRASFARQAAMSTLGATLTRVAPGAVTIELPFRADLTQQNGYLHAGIVAAIADSACGYAAYTLAPADSDVLAIEFKINLLEPARGERFEATAHVLRSGRTIVVAQADVTAHHGGEQTIVATLIDTVIVLLPRR